ncbi:MAG: two-component sensor histidine kinase, partial [Hyphomonadaceae bacterium]
MKLGAFNFLRTTTFRLALLYTVLFAVFSAGLLTYLFFSTVGYIRAEATGRIEAEVAALQEAYRAGGIERLNQSIFERRLVPGRYFIYQLETVGGFKVNGDLTGMPEEASQTGVRQVNFSLDARAPDASIVKIEVEGRVARFGPDHILLVGYNRDDN